MFVQEVYHRSPRLPVNDSVHTCSLNSCFQLDSWPQSFLAETTFQPLWCGLGGATVGLRRDLGLEPARLRRGMKFGLTQSSSSIAPLFFPGEKEVAPMPARLFLRPASIALLLLSSAAINHAQPAPRVFQDSQASLQVSPPAGIPPAAPVSREAQSQSVLPFHTDRSFIMVSARINGQEATFLLDTGAQRTIITPQLSGLSPVELATSPQIEINSPTLAGSSTVPVVSVRFGIGNTMLTTRVIVTSIRKYDGIIGNDVLSQFKKITIDHKQHTLTLEY